MSQPARRESARAAWAGVDGDGLGAMIDWAELRRRGWDPDAQVFAPPGGDLIFGVGWCVTANCDQMVHHPGLGLCRRCQQLWEQAPSTVSFEEFCQTAPARIKPHGGGLCLVCRTPGHERPVRGRGLCTACAAAARDRGQTVAAYVAGDDCFPPAAPRPTFGRCVAGACVRWAHRAEPALCEAHERSWIAVGRPTGSSLQTWCARARALDVGSRVVMLGGLAERALLEMLYGLHCATRAERPTRVKALQAAVNRLRVEEAASVASVAVDGLPRDARSFLVFTRDRVALASTSPAEEVGKDRWDLRVFGYAGGWMHFGQLSQPWLRDGAKEWARERLAGVENPARLDQVLHDLGPFSESLRRHRRDRGADLRQLSRQDMAELANDLSHLEAAGRLSLFMRRRVQLDVDQFLREARSMGLTRAGRPMLGLPDDVVLPPDDRIRRSSPSDDELGRALPQAVVDQLIDPAALDRLEAAFDAGTRAMVELQALVGRRTAELCGLRWDCLRVEEVLDETGRHRPAPVLAHDMPKVGVRGYLLPIDEEAAEIIRAQQARVRARHPGTPTSQLALFPALARNLRGVKPFNRVTFCERIRAWVHDLPRLVGPDGEDYDRCGITVYSFRHSFAQRHADGGTPVDVVADLMGHTKLSTTQGYYHVTHKRKRQAVDQLARLQLDRRAERTRPTVERLLDSEHLRDAVGQVAVPFGICREPTNVKAHGQACPFRHQCFGCTHFRTDPSFLPELRAHLRRLLADEERLRAAAPELEEWARNAAIPSAEEIAAVRAIVDRCEGLLADEADDERPAIEEAMVVLRRSRAQLDTSVPVRFLGVVGTPTPRLFPNVVRDQKHGDAS
jgi:integrase